MIEQCPDPVIGHCSILFSSGNVQVAKACTCTRWPLPRKVAAWWACCAVMYCGGTGCVCA
jgi:hypothetical protein